MSDFKEVWYVWDGENPVTGVRHFIYGDTGRMDNNTKPEEPLGSMYHDEYITHYTLGQKRRRVECGKCEDGVVTIQHRCGFFRRVYCHHCNGTGKTWEYEE